MIDQDKLRRWWDVFVGDGCFTEVRILGRFQYSGYFRSFDNLVRQIEPYTNMDDEQLYFVLNAIDESCYGRQQCEKIVKSPKITTNDNDIVCRKWVLCDFDPIRKSGTNATESQFELAHKKAQDVFRFLRDKGFTEPVICKSGNGWHLLIRVDIAVSEDATEVIKGFFKYMGKAFTDEKVEFDEKNFNNARICKLYGTMAKKGANLPDMPWRMSEIVYVPKEIVATPIEKFKEIADLLPKEEPKTPNRTFNRPYNNATFDLRTWLNEHGVVYKEEKQGASTRFTLEYCPWVDQHSDRKKWDSALFLDGEGKITFNCQHSHCKDKTWHDVRLFYEPNAYDRPIYMPRERQYAQQQRKVHEIKDVIPELGEKWKSLSSIKKVDLSEMQHVKTGITELDRAIIGLYMCEVTLLSGSNSSGKSSWLNTLILNVVQQGVNVALWSGELPDYILKTWIQMVAAGRSHLRQSTYNDGKYYVPTDVGNKIDEWLEGKLFIYNNEYGCEWQQIFHDMSELLKVGVKLFVLDNLFSMNIDILEGDKNNKQKELILQIKDFAKKNQVHIILVAHPRKTTSFLRKNDISGTSDLTNAVDDCFIIHRVNQDFFKSGAEYFGQSYIQKFQGYGNVIEVCKNRLYGVVDLMVGMHYEIESRRFKNDVNENVRYGWEVEPTQSTVAFTNVNVPQQQVNSTPQAQGYDTMPFAAPNEDEATF